MCGKEWKQYQLFGVITYKCALLIFTMFSLLLPVFIIDMMTLEGNILFMLQSTVNKKEMPSYGQQVLKKAPQNLRVTINRFT